MIEERNSLLEVRFVLLVLALSGWLMGLVGCSPGTPAALPSVTPGPTSSAVPVVTQSGPTETMRTIALESLDQGNSYTAELENPTIFVAGSIDEAAHFTGWLNDADVTERIREVDFNTDSDINGDCSVDIRDLTITGVNYGRSCPTPWVTRLR